MSTPLTLMAVHAHPDDESSSTGGVLARYADEAREPGGDAWTVRIIRPTDPRSRRIVYSNWYLPTVLWTRAKRVLRANRRWIVEALPSPETNWERAVAVDEVQGKDKAVDRAIQALQDITAGRPPSRSEDA